MSRVVAVTTTVLLVLVGSGCGGGDDPDAAPTTGPTTSPGADADAEVTEEPGTEDPDAAAPVPDLPPDEELEVVECSDLEGPVNLALQSVGCTVDGARAPVSALPCEDGRTVLIAGDRYGIEGETWQSYDVATDPPATELC